MSIIINTRIQEALKKYGNPLQFGASPNMGCPEDSFSLRSLLQMRKEHSLQSWVVFADLIKAFDSIDHKLLFALLEKFSIPSRPLQAIMNLYKNFEIELKIGKCKTRIDYTAGVKQGDNLAPTLFIIVMHSLSELLETKFKENNISIPSFFHNSNLYNKGGKLIRHETTISKTGKMASYNSRRPLTKDELFLLLYVDDGALIFTNRSDTILGSKIAFTQMERMGLNIEKIKNRGHVLPIKGNNANLDRRK